MSDGVSVSASTPSREGGSADPDVPRSSASASTPASTEGVSARSASASAEADPLRSSTSDPAVANPLDAGFKTTATPGGVIMSNAAFQELVSQARAGGAVISGDREEAVFHPSFRVSDGASAATVKVWFGSPLAIPEDLVRAFNAGNNIPLSLLTVAAIRDFGINQRRSTFQPKMSGRLLEEFESWHSRDDFLPFAEWCQAIFTLIHLFRSVRAAPPDESPDDDPIYQLTEHALSIISRANAYAWPVYRDYDKRVRQEIWSARHRGVPIPFRINSLHIPTLDDAEVMIKGRGGALADFAAIIESGWSAVVTAPSSEVSRLGRKLDESHSVSAACILEEEMVPAGPPQAHAGYSLSRSASTSKRKASEDANGSPNRSRSAHHSFQRSVSAPFFPPSQQPSFPPSPQPAFPPSQHSGFQPPPFPGFTPFQQPSFQRPTPPGPKGPAFCSVCLAFTSTHVWDSCPGPYPDGLASSPFGKGWIWKGKLRTACARWNAGTPEPSVTCHFGHYCMQCGQDGCRARDHGTRDTNGNVLTSGAPPGAGPGAGAAPTYHH
ncbi:hypothetical protein CF319_g5296 [Tilletia indica]|nr:hypothetical protein CF319_g5296 [Tilletia indica]